MGNNRSIPFLKLQEHQKYTELFNENSSVAVKKNGGGGIVAMGQRSGHDSHDNPERTGLCSNLERVL
jgi:hypothetical protein